MLRDKLNGMIEVSRLKDEKAGQLFLGFRIGAVGRRDFAVFPVQSHGGLRRLKRYFGSHMSVGAQTVVILKAFVEHCVLLVLGHPFEFSWLHVSQTDVFHRFLLVSCDSLFAAIQSRCSSPLSRKDLRFETTLGQLVATKAMSLESLWSIE